MKRLVSLVSLVVVALAFILGCALSKPLIVQNCGFLLAQQKPELAQEILKVSRDFLAKAPSDFTEASFQIWTTSVIEKLEVDPLLKMNFEEMIKSVDVKIELSSNQQEMAQLVRGVIQNFIKGIEAAR